MSISRREFLKTAAFGAAAVAALGVVGTGLAAETPAAGAVPLSATPAGDPVYGADGVYTNAAQGRNGLVPVTIEIKDGKIVSAEVGEHIETNVFTTDAIPALLESIVEHNSYAVDSVSGATWTSAAIKTAVRLSVTEAGGNAAAYGVVPPVEAGADEEASYDVIVVGGGLSGLVAATRAASEGCAVALVEKVGLLGGCSLQSFATAIHEGEEAIQEKFYNWIQGQHYMVDTSLLHRYLTTNREAIDFLCSFNEHGSFIGLPMPFLITYMDRAPVYADLMAVVEAAGGKVYLETTVESLLVEDGAVSGLEAARRDGSTLTLYGKAVVIATGGFGGNTGLVKQYSGFDVVCGCPTQCVGEGMQMAFAVGAKVPSNLGGLMLHQTLATANLVSYPYFQMRMPMVMGYVPSVLNVTKAGVRFRDETWVNVATAASTSGAFAGGLTYALLDQSMIDKLMQGGTTAIGFASSPGMPPEYKPSFTPDTPWEDFDKVLEDMVGGGWGHKGDTIEELAEAAGMDPAILTATFEAYQGYCESGADLMFGKRAEYLVGYESGPYYLIGITYNQLGTSTGLVINSHMQVIDTEDYPIPGLYSTGSEAYSVLWDHNYCGSGEGIGWAITSGYMGGGEAAAYALGI